MVWENLPVSWATLQTLKNWPHHSSVLIYPLAPNTTENSVQNKLSVCYKCITHTALTCLWLFDFTHLPYSPLCFWHSQPPDSSHQTLHCWFPRAFSVFSPSPSSPTETLSGLLQIKPQDISFSKTIALPCFPFHAVVFLCRKSLFGVRLSWV